MDQQLTILVVDDEPEVASVLGSALDEQEYQIRCVQKWTEAIAEIHETPPDVVLLDLYLPTVQGEALLEFIKNLDSDLPVIIVSSEIEPDKMQQLGRLGASGFVRKPFERDNLIVVVEQVLTQWGNDLSSQAPAPPPKPPQPDKPIIKSGAGTEKLEQAQPRVEARPASRRRSGRPVPKGRNRAFIVTFLACILATWLLTMVQEMFSSGFFGMDIRDTRETTPK